MHYIFVYVKQKERIGLWGGGVIGTHLIERFKKRGDQVYWGDFADYLRIYIYDS